MDLAAYTKFRSAGEGVPDPSLRAVLCKVIRMLAYAENTMPANHYERRCIRLIVDAFAIKRSECDDVSDNWGAFPEEEDEG